MRSKLMILAVAALLAAPALALGQEEGQRHRGRPPGRPGGDEQGPPQAEKLIEHMAQALKQRLGLDEDQQAKVNELVAAFKEGQALNKDDEADFGKLREELRDAQQAGDDERVAEVREQIRDRMRGAGDAMRSFLDEVEPILNEEQLVKFQEFKRRMPQQPGGEGDGRDARDRMAKIVRDMRAELKLEGEQAEMYNQAVADLRASGEKSREHMREIGTLMRDLRKAKQDGDDEKAAELRAQIDEKRGDPQAAAQQFFDAVEAMLTDEQKPIVAKYREQMRERGPGEGGGDHPQGARIEDLFRAAQRLDLDEEQSQKLREIRGRAGRASREFDKEDTQALETLAGNVKDKVLEILTDEQKTQFEENLASSKQPEKPGKPDKGKRPEHKGKAKKKSDNP